MNNFNSNLLLLISSPIFSNITASILNNEELRNTICNNLGVINSGCINNGLNRIANVINNGGPQSEIKLQIESIISNFENRSSSKVISQELLNKLNRIYIKNGENNGEFLNCPICLIEMKGELCESGEATKILIQLPCHHIYDEQCILFWLSTQNTCPCCRMEVKESHFNVDSPD